jgi:hypothetical protein
MMTLNHWGAGVSAMVPSYGFALTGKRLGNRIADYGIPVIRFCNPTKIGERQNIMPLDEPSLNGVYAN